MQRYSPLFGPISLIRIVFDVIQALLLARFFLILFGANRVNVFVEFILRLTNPLVRIFSSIFSPTVISGLTIEWSTIIAMIFYSFIWMLLIRIVVALFATAEPLSRSSP